MIPLIALGYLLYSIWVVAELKDKTAYINAILTPNEHEQTTSKPTHHVTQ